MAVMPAHHCIMGLAVLALALGLELFAVSDSRIACYSAAVQHTALVGFVLFAHAVVMLLKEQRTAAP
jgi:hypothetical protein